MSMIILRALNNSYSINHNGSTLNSCCFSGKYSGNINLYALRYIFSEF